MKRRPRIDDELAELYRKAAEVAERLTVPAFNRITGGKQRDDAYYGAWLASHARVFKRQRK